LHVNEAGQPPIPAPIKPRTVWWVLAACLVAISAYLLFLGLTATYNNVSATGGYTLHRVACLSVYGWLGDEGGHQSAVQAEASPDEQDSVGCHAAINDRETTIEVLLGIAVVFAIIGYRAGRAPGLQAAPGIGH
jgi:hypothetical protein